MFKTVLIANRGEIACRVMKTCREMGIRTVAVYSDADAGAMHVAMADEAYRLGPAPVAESYLQADRILAIAKASGAEAIHPGYGFLAENADFADAIEAAGLTFIGPKASSIRAMGLKDAAKALMTEANVPVVPGYHGDNQDADFLAAEADKIGYPVLIKAVSGGGGKGMRRVDDPADFAAALEGAQREGASAFGDPNVLIEKYITKPRHVEIQVFADRHGNAVHLFERDCSLQRRHQKVIEEAPAPDMPLDMREAMGEAAVQAAKAIAYEGAGTVEFIVDASEGLRSDRFWFMEMNTRLQVEHPVTEYITGTDLVSWQLKVASGEALPVVQDDLAISGHALEVRLYAEDAAKGFLPATGTLHHLVMPMENDATRIDTGVRQGDVITPFYDPMIAKLIVHGENRADAFARMAYALDRVELAGSVTNLDFLQRLVSHQPVLDGDVDTGLIERDFDALTASPAPSQAAMVAAALYEAGAFEVAASDDPWDQLTGFRLAGAARHFAHLQCEGEEHEIAVHFHRDGSASMTLGEDDVRVSATILSDTRFRLDFGDRIETVSVYAHADQVTVFDNGATHIFAIIDRQAADLDQGAGQNAIKAPLPGKLNALSVSEGQTVAKGDALAILEAMKMEHTLAAPRDGVIAALHVGLGDQVEEGAVLIELAEEDA